MEGSELRPPPVLFGLECERWWSSYSVAPLSLDLGCFTEAVGDSVTCTGLGCGVSRMKKFVCLFYMFSGVVDSLLG
jgi:hypothetical protein